MCNAWYEKTPGERSTAIAAPAGDAPTAAPPSASARGPGAAVARPAWFSPLLHGEQQTPSSMAELAGQLGYSVSFPAECGRCGRSVWLFAVPSGAFAVLDDLGSPWPEHACAGTGEATEPALTVPPVADRVAHVPQPFRRLAGLVVHDEKPPAGDRRRVVIADDGTLYEVITEHPGPLLGHTVHGVCSDEKVPRFVVTSIERTPAAPGAALEGELESLERWAELIGPELPEVGHLLLQALDAARERAPLAFSASLFKLLRVEHPAVTSPFRLEVLRHLHRALEAGRLEALVPLVHRSLERGRGRAEAAPGRGPRHRGDLLRTLLRQGRRERAHLRQLARRWPALPVAVDELTGLAA